MNPQAKGKARILEAVVDAWMEAGVELGTAERLAGFTLKIGTMAVLMELTEKLGDKVWFAALRRVALPDGETQAEAARRLCVSRAALRKAEMEISARLTEGGYSLLLGSGPKT